MAKKEKYILGLDLGANSIGWALLKAGPSAKEEKLKPFGIEKAGVRIFEAGVEGDIESGRDESRSVARRDARGIRRRLDRNARRLSSLFSQLQEAGLLPVDDKLKKPKTKSKRSREDQRIEREAEAKERHVIINKFDQKILPAYKKEIELAPKKLPYLLRAKALDKKLEPHEIGRALYHLGQRRGFLSNRKANSKKDDDLGKVKQGILELEGKMEAVDARTLGEYFSKLNPEQERIRSRWTSRKMYDDEFNAIWDSQAKDWPGILKPELKKKIYKTIFHQRPLKIQHHLIGKCQYEEGRRRAPFAILAAQKFRILQQVNNTYLIDQDGVILEFTPEQRQILLAALDKKSGISFKGAMKLLGLKNYHFNFEKEEGKGEFLGNETSAKLIDLFGEEKWNKFTGQEKDQIVEDLFSIQHQKGLEKRGKEKWGLDEKKAEEFSEINLEEGYCGLSRQALAKLIPLMEQGKKYMEAVKEVYPDRFKLEEKEFLPMLQEEMPELTNPVVKRVISELRKVVNAIIREYGRPEEIRIELARDLKKTRKQRKEIWEKNKQNENVRKDAAEKIIKEAGIPVPRRADIEKYLLWQESNGRCPYTGKTINIKKLFGGEVDVEHIIPFSVCLDNSYYNKTLCDAEENRKRKNNKTPWQAYGSDEKKWDDILARVKQFGGQAAKDKLRRFQLKELDDLDDFVSSQLNDTRYASTLSKKYLGFLYGEKAMSRVQASKGGITAYLRDVWGLNKILGDGGEKSRADHRHHAVDAITIALTDRSTVKKLSDASKRALHEKRNRFGKMEKPWEHFWEDVKKAKDETTVSHRVTRKINGAIHESTLYGPQKKDNKGQTYSHVRKPLSAPLTKKESENIVDPVIAKIVISKLQELGGDFKKLGLKENHPFLISKDGRKIPIHKVRIKKPNTTEKIGSTIGERNVEIGSNHHIEIYEVKDENGNIKWSGDVVSRYEAMKRQKNGKKIVNVDHGANSKFIFSLARNESILMKDGKGVENIWIVQKISQNEQIFFIKHNDARIKKEIPSEEKISKQPEPLRKSGAKKVLITPLGDIRWAND